MLEWDTTPQGLATFSVDAIYERQSTTLRQATARYELKTGRKTPKGYEKWFEWVSSRGLLVDEYDQVSRILSSRNCLLMCAAPVQIYSDFQPYYDLKSPHHIRKTIEQVRMSREARKGRN